MKTILQTALLLSAAYVLSACAGSGSNNNNAATTTCSTINGVYQCNSSATNGTQGTISCVQQLPCTQPGTAYSCDLTACLPITAQCALVTANPTLYGGVQGWTYAQNGSRCWPVKLY